MLPQYLVTSPCRFDGAKGEPGRSRGGFRPMRVLPMQSLDDCRALTADSRLPRNASTCTWSKCSGTDQCRDTNAVICAFIGQRPQRCKQPREISRAPCIHERHVATVQEFAVHRPVKRATEGAIHRSQLSSGCTNSSCRTPCCPPNLHRRSFNHSPTCPRWSSLTRAAMYVGGKSGLRPGRSWE
jgi:hypothetical protein